ncbi:DUF342 domain-containing protein [Geoalkalibacter subterraneus]|uniref:Flagellar Assembly Protein A N-terminal region domain-containing protein n=1 Tax=Geoalkalibacter subterraneus TaxID=483547 RepID=A0A0B5FS09_9BACT|nr:FapA family protein [Geoalkalibacter subterraneus]AJF07439.1 hypothetical protein GSUB_13920 [Geoalkalibacter subterraneus]
MSEKQTEQGQEKKPDNVLLEEDNERHSLVLEVVKNAMECRLSVTPKSKSGQLEKDEVIDLLADQGVTQGLVDNQIRAMCRDLSKGKTANSFLVAEGKEPKPGPDGYLELFVKAAAETPDYHEDEEGNIDFRTLNFFTNVFPEQEIGVIRPPEYGDEGYTVTGEPLPPLLGKPLKLTVGSGARLKEDGKTVISEIEGRVLYDGKTVSVTEEYVVPGDVDLSVGNIDFRGFVEVRGDVLDDFDIHSGKGILVKGNVGICEISSAGDIALGGMAGQGRGRIVCGGNLVTTYLNDVTVECEGDVFVKNEVRNARIYASGIVSLPNGNIFGGETYGLGGIEVKNAGAASGIKTRLYAGIDYTQIKLAQQRDEAQLEFVEINDQLAILSQLLKQNKMLSADDKKKVIELSARINEINQLKEELEEKIARARVLAKKKANGKINIKGRIGEGVILHIGDTTEEIKIERQSAVSIIENRKAQGFHFLSLTPLSTSAEELEKEIEEDAEDDDVPAEWGQ